MRRFCFPWIRCFHSPKVAGLGIAAAGGAVSIPQRCDWKEHLDQIIREGRHQFQYLKGAIGSAPVVIGDEVVGRFQYLKGAIGSVARAIERGQVVIFQHLKGAIGRPPPPSPTRPPLPNFNTSKVRLEGVVDHLPERAELYFNTSKVRLEGRRSFKAPLSSAERQFAAWNSGHNIVIRRFRVNPRRVTRWHKVLGSI